MRGSNQIQQQTKKLYYTQLQNLHTKHFGKSYTSFEELSAHGSDRFIARLKSDSGTCVGIVNSNLHENRAFLGFGQTFHENGMNVPRIYSVAKDEGSYLLEDLGDETLAQKVNSDWETGKAEKFALYEKGIAHLVRFQIEMRDKVDYNLCYQYSEFGEENIIFDINYFKERFLKQFYKSPFDENQLDAELNFLKDKILELPRDYFLYRDFQSRNIMLHNNDLYFIDFQSGRRGALLYDLAALLYNAKANIPQNIREQLLEHYIESASKKTNIDSGKYKSYFWYFALIRILQALGAYGFVGLVKNKPKFLESIPYALKNIDFVLNERIENNELKYLRAIFRELINEKT